MSIHGHSAKQLHLVYVLDETVGLTPSKAMAGTEIE